MAGQIRHHVCVRVPKLGSRVYFFVDSSYDDKDAALQRMRLLSEQQSRSLGDDYVPVWVESCEGDGPHLDQRYYAMVDRPASVAAGQ